MNRSQKAEYVDTLSQRIQAAPLIMLADYRGVNVADISRFRDHLRERGVQYEVIKNTLALRAIAGTSHEGLSEHLTGMVGWVFSGEDPIDAAKAVKEVSKTLEFTKRELFVVKGGYFEGEAIGADEIIAVASLPGRDELLSKLLATLIEGPRQVMGVIQGPARDLLYVLKNYEQKLSDEAGEE